MRPPDPLSTHAGGEPALHVVCLCAAWCGVCRDYRATFDAAASAFGARAAFRTIDIEDEADLLDDLEVENFPTLLITRGAQVLFFGTVTPQPATLSRLVEQALAGGLPPPAQDAAAGALAQRLGNRTNA
jgi:thioredoxin 1